MTTAECSTHNANGNNRDLLSDTLNVLQLSDPHLFTDPEGRLLGMRTLTSLQHVIKDARSNLSSIDFALVTGDLVHDASTEGYFLLKKELLNLAAPTYCLPGNHDDPKILKRAISGTSIDTPFSIQKKRWSIILLNSNRPGSTKGHLNDEQLSNLQQTLSRFPNHHTLICLHHHVVPVKSRWLDTMILNNADAFFAIIDQHPQIRGIACGHIHQTFEATRKNVRLMGSPSTCFQFKPNSTRFGIDDKAPGYRQLTLLPNGTIITKIIHLKHFSNSIDLSSSGY